MRTNINGRQTGDRKKLQLKYISPTENDYRFYVDGISLVKNTIPYDIPDASTGLTIGSAEGLGYFDVLFDEVQIWNETLSAAAFITATIGNRRLKVFCLQ